MEPFLLHCQNYSIPKIVVSKCNHNNFFNRTRSPYNLETSRWRRRNSIQLTASQFGRRFRLSSRTTAAIAGGGGGGVPLPPLDLTEDNIIQVMADARVELAQLFDSSVGITGVAELAELDGPFVKIRLKGRFWHKRSTVVARLGNYLKQRIPEILEVDIEDEKQLDDSPENF